MGPGVPIKFSWRRLPPRRRGEVASFRRKQEAAPTNRGGFSALSKHAAAYSGSGSGTSTMSASNRGHSQRQHSPVTMDCVVRIMPVTT